MKKTAASYFRYFDVHAHLHDPRISKRIPAMVDRARKAGVDFVASCATMEKNFQETQALALSYPGVIPCFGIHPWFLDSLSHKWETALGEQLDGLPSAVGETGLDFMDRETDREFQLSVFRTHLALARDLGRPINIHIRKAWDAFVHLLKEMGPLPAGGVVHSYSGSADLVKVLTAHNLYLSFSGAATRPNAKKTLKALREVPLDRIVFETDTPDLFPSLDPQPDIRHRPLNEPKYVVDVVNICARRRGLPVEKFAGYGYRNALQLFDSILPK